MKKTTKVTKALTPAKKTAKVVKTSAAPAVATKVEPTAVVPAPAPTPVPVAVVAPKPAAPKATTPKAVAPKAVAPKTVAVASAPAPKAAPAVVVTTISANFDVGFGNALYVRGEGPGLSWEKGALMACVTGDTWSVALGESAKPYVFKFLINDEVWSGGEDYVAPSGSSVTLTPAFPGW